MPPNTSSPRAGFQDLDTLRTSNDVIGIISSRPAGAGGKRIITFSVMKEFLRDGKVERTAFFPASFLPDVRKMHDLLEKRIAELEAEGLS